MYLVPPTLVTTPTVELDAFVAWPLFTCFVCWQIYIRVPRKHKGEVDETSSYILYVAYIGGTLDLQMFKG